MFFRLHIVLLVIFLASNLVAAMDQRIPADQIKCAAQKFVSTLLAVTEPPYGEESNDPMNGSWMGYFPLHMTVAAKMVGKKDKAEAEIARYYFDPEFNKWLAIKKILPEQKALQNVYNPQKQLMDLLSWNIPARVPFLYAKTLRALVGGYSISHQDYERVFGETSYRLSGAIINRVVQGTWYSELFPFNSAIGLHWYEDQFFRYVHRSLEDDLKPIADYNAELWDWYKTEGVAEGTRERINASGVREMAMRTYKTADSL